MERKAVISDDLTGAMDAGVQLTQKGYGVSVIFDDYGTVLSHCRGDVVIFDTESRNVPQDDAYRRIVEGIGTIQKNGIALCYKKVDSTLRGNLGSEIDALLDKDKSLMVAFTPALPYNGRKTRNGKQYVNDKLLTESDLAKDPFCSVRSAFIPDLLGIQTKAKAAIVNIDNVEAGSIKLQGIFKQFYESKVRIAVLDAESDQDLQTIAEAITLSGLNILPVGSAGLFPFLFQDKHAPCKTHTILSANAPVLVLSGSPAKASKNQINYASRHGVEVVQVRMDAVTSGSPESEVEFNRVRSEVFAYFEKGKDVVIDAAGSSKEKIGNQMKGNMQKLFSDSAAIQKFSSELVKEALLNYKIDGLMVVGGDTALKIFKILGAKSIFITGEPEPYIPAGILEDGQCDGLSVVTKAGGFGSEKALINCIEYMKAR